MSRDPHAEIKHTHHTARWFPGPGRWVIIDQSQEAVAVIATNTTNYVTKITITLVLDEHGLPLDPITRPGSMRTTIRWVCQELNNGNLWLGTRLFLEREARLLDYDESELLACWHAYDYQYCLRLLTNLPGLLDWERKERAK